ncbi:MAG TPA: glycine zipper family protein [Alphaproteobacteria bacterium]|nr:glycine zipper family protein [Alphaproteobacteria bacterium]
MLRTASAAALLGTLLLGACAVTPPTGPSVMALPAKGKTFAEFQQDDAACQQFAAASIGYGSPADAANQSAIGSAAVGTVVGAAAGAVLGAAAGNPAAGAAIGAGSGLLLGGVSGLGNAQASAGTLQQRYDMRYIQCMSAKGESVPVPAGGVSPPYAYYSYGAYAFPRYYYYPYYPYW